MITKIMQHALSIQLPFVTKPYIIVLQSPAILAGIAFFGKFDKSCSVFHNSKHSQFNTSRAPWYGAVYFGYLYPTITRATFKTIPIILPSQSSRIYQFQLLTIEMMATMIFATICRVATPALIGMISLFLFIRYSLVSSCPFIFSVKLDSILKGCK